MSFEISCLPRPFQMQMAPPMPSITVLCMIDGKFDFRFKGAASTKPSHNAKQILIKSNLSDQGQELENKQSLDFSGHLILGGIDHFHSATLLCTPWVHIAWNTFQWFPKCWHVLFGLYPSFLWYTMPCCVQKESYDMFAPCFKVVSYLVSFWYGMK